MLFRAKGRSAAWVLAAALAAAACGGGGDAGKGAEKGKADEGTPERGGTATIAVSTDFQAFNPVTNTALTTDDVIKHMLFTPLIQYDEKLQPIPWLAERWELADTGVVFHLRGDVKWHDGRPVTAEDVKFTFDLAKDPATASLLGSAYITLVDRAEVVDPRTIRFHFSAPHAQALDGFWWAPLPKHLLQNVPAAQLSQNAFNRNPVGSGPFRFGEWRPNNSLTLVANDSFPAALGGRPNLDRVVFRVIPEATTMVTELVSGSADMIGYTLQPDQAMQVKQQQGLELRHYPSREFTFLAWNNTRDLFRDAAVRRALTLAIDRPSIIQGLLQGFAVPAFGMIPPWSPMYSDIGNLPFDANQARQLLAHAGWRDTNGDRVLDKDGRPFRFTLLVNSANRLHQDMATVIQQQLAAVGVQVDLRTQEFQSMLQQYKARDYDAVLANWSLDTFKVDPTPLFSCAQARVANSANRTGYCNPQADALMERGLRATDPAQGKQAWEQFSRLLQQDQPVTFLYWSEDLSGLGPRLHGVVTDARSKIVNIRQWWIPARMQR
ncbi:MAG TPA: ABC transporter substrate-binding protein [Longimicrobium sp.]|nr:ABC transporter substrate-binding protein [Longimicrobium sp.]